MPKKGKWNKTNHRNGKNAPLDPERKNARVLYRHEEWCWHIENRPYHRFYDNYINKLFNQKLDAICLDKFLDKHFIVVDDTDLSRKEEKLLVNLLRPKTNTGESK